MVSELVNPDEIEDIVGRKRHLVNHYARAVSEEQTVYILHSKLCKDGHEDLRNCHYSQALDRGIDEVWANWAGVQDRPVLVEIKEGYLIPHRFVDNMLRPNKDWPLEDATYELENYDLND